jgi:uncharacterized membrane protein YgcG
VPVPAGEDLGPGDLQRLERAVEVAERFSGLTFTLVLGRSEQDPRSYAEQLHAGLPDPDGSVLVMCDPVLRALEIVTGSRTRRVLDDLDCRLAAASMQTSFTAGDLVGGLVTGIQQLGLAARKPETLHTSRL